LPKSPELPKLKKHSAIGIQHSAKKHFFGKVSIRVASAQAEFQVLISQSSVPKPAQTQKFWI